MTGDGVAILGSARSNGNTAALLARLLDGRRCDVFDLLAVRVAPFDYSQQYLPDDFLDIVHRIIAAPVTVFATPVYWYTMSASMKGFVDRLSDLLMSQKELGRQLRGKRFALLSSSEEPEPDLVSVFRRTCEYLGVEYLGCAHAKADGPFADPELVARLRELLPPHESLPA